MKNFTLDPGNANVVFITIDSCRYDTAEQAHIPFLAGLGGLACAYTPGNYTVPAHHAFFVGHLPTAFTSAQPYYSGANGQLWRIKTGAGEDSGAWVTLQGKNILEGYRNLGFYVLGVGGVTQFNKGSQLREYFGQDFLYWGPNLDEEPCASRPEEWFPLLHCGEIVDKLQPHEKWFLFVNCPETHFPYDTGEGLMEDKLEILRLIRPHFNLRESDAPINTAATGLLRRMQIKALEAVNTRIANLFAALPRERPILVVICGDHGEMFGEVFAGKPRFGHIISSPEVLRVPLIIGWR
ncbi:MAG: hypothetical protein AAB547_02270 [Patescibacteria group bacterium]